MKALEPPEMGASYEDFLADLQREKEQIQRKTILLRMGFFILCFIFFQPREAWVRPALGGTLATTLGAFVAQYCLYRGWFERLAWRFLKRACFGSEVVLLVFAVVMSVRGVYEAIAWLWAQLP